MTKILLTTSTTSIPVNGTSMYNSPSGGGSGVGVGPGACGRMVKTYPPGYESVASMSRPATTPSLEAVYRNAPGALPNFQRPVSRSSQRPPRPQSSASCLGQSSLGKMRDPRSYFLKTREFSDDGYPSSAELGEDVMERPDPMAERQALEPYDGPRMAKLVALEEAQKARAMKEVDSWSRPGSRGRIDLGKGGKLEVHSPAWDTGNLLNRIKRTESRSPATPSRFRVSRGGTHSDYVSVGRKNQGVTPSRPATSPCAPHIFSLSSLARAPRLAGSLKQKPHINLNLQRSTSSKSTHPSTEKEIPMDLNVKNTWMEDNVHHKRLIAPRSCMEFTEYQYGTNASRIQRSKGGGAYTTQNSSLKEHRSLRTSDALSNSCCNDFDLSIGVTEHDSARRGTEEEEADISSEPKYAICRSQKGKADAMIRQTLEQDRAYSREMQLRKQSTMHGLEAAGRAAPEHRSTAFFSLLTFEEHSDAGEEEGQHGDAHHRGEATAASSGRPTTATALAIAAAVRAAESGGRSPGGLGRLGKKKKSAEQIPRPQWLMHVLGLNTASGNFSSPRWPDDIPVTLDGLKESPIGFIRFEREEKEELILVFQLYTSLIHRASEMKITRPCWCRYIVDTGLVDVTDETDYRCVESFSNFLAFEAPKPDLSYRRAIQYFDAHALPLAAHNNMRVISDWDGVNLTSALLAYKKFPESAQKDFMTRILELKELLRKRLSKGPSFPRTAEPPNLSRISTHLMQVPPPLTITMPEWVQGLLNWQKTYFPPPGEKPHDGIASLTQSSTLNERLAEQECIAAMILEPEIVHWEHIFRPLILESLFRTYVDFDGGSLIMDSFDGFRDTTGTVASWGHMSLGAWMRFCTDFRIYPHLATREEVQTMYESAQCAEREYKVKQQEIPPMMLRGNQANQLRPKESPPLSPKSGRSGASGRSGGMQNAGKPRPSSREKVATINTTPSGSGGIASKTQTGGGSSKPSSAGQQSASGRAKAKSKSKVRLDVGNAPQSAGLPIIDYSWMRENVVLLSRERQIALAMLRNLNALLRDRFLKIQDLCKFLGLGKNKTGSLSCSDILTILSFCKLVDEEKTLTETDIEGILKEIDKSATGDGKSITLEELSRALLRVNELNKLPGSKARPQEFGESEALFLSINRKVGQLSSVPLLEARHIFGYPAFTECLLKLALKYLTLAEGSTSTAASTPIFAKAVWLIAFLEQGFQKILRDKAKFEAGEGTNAWMKETKRSKKASSQIFEDAADDARELEEERKQEEERIRAERIASLRPEETPFREYQGARDAFTQESFFCFDFMPKDEAKTCTNCNEMPPWSGWGKGMCQRCFLAHIDGIPIPQSLFYPIFEPLVNDAKDEGKESETEKG